MYSAASHGPFTFCHVLPRLVCVLLRLLHGCRAFCPVLSRFSRQARVDVSRFVAFCHSSFRFVTVCGPTWLRRAAFYYGLTRCARSGTEHKSRARQRNFYSCLSCETTINRSRPWSYATEEAKTYERLPSCAITSSKGAKAAQWSTAARKVGLTCCCCCTDLSQSQRQFQSNGAQLCDLSFDMHAVLYFTVSRHKASEASSDNSGLRRHLRCEAVWWEMLSSDPAVAFCLPITIRAPHGWILTFSSVFFVFFLSAALCRTAAGLRLAGAKTSMHQANIQTQNLFLSLAFMTL